MKILSYSCGRGSVKAILRSILSIALDMANEGFILDLGTPCYINATLVFRLTR